MSQAEVQVPLFPLKTVLFPGGVLPLRIFETRYLDMISHCLREDRGFGVVAVKAGGETGTAEVHGIGTLARIVDWYQFEDGLLGITALGETRFMLKSLEQQADGLNLGMVEFMEPEGEVALPDRYRPLLGLLESVMNEIGGHYKQLEPRFDDASWVGCRLAELLPLSLEQKQMCLEVSDPIQRLEVLYPALEKYTR